MNKIDPMLLLAGSVVILVLGVIKMFLDYKAAEFEYHCHKRHHTNMEQIR